MFIIDVDPTFTRDVKLTTPGAGAPRTITLEFQYRDRDQLDAWRKSIVGRSDDDVIPEIVIGWEDVADKDGNQVYFSRDALRQLLVKFPAASAEIFRDYLAALTETRQKN